MLHVMQSPRPQPPTRRPPPRPKPVVRAPGKPPAVTTVRRHTFRMPDVREIPRRTLAGPWEA